MENNFEAPESRWFDFSDQGNGELLLIDSRGKPFGLPRENGFAMIASSKIVVGGFRTVQLALLAVSLLLLAVPPTRNTAMHACLTTLLTLECAWLIYKVWRQRLLNVTPETSVDRLMASGRVTSDLLERSSLLAGFAAVVLLAF